MSLDSYIRKLDDDIDHFIGEELDEEKMEQLKKLRSVCRRIAELSPDIKATFLPFSNRSINGTAFLELPRVTAETNTTVSRFLGRAFTLSDAFGISAREDGTGITIGFVVHNMWSKFGYDNDMEHGK